MKSLNIPLSHGHPLKLIFQGTWLLSERPPFPASLQVGVATCLFFFYLAVPLSMQGLSSPDQGSNLSPPRPQRKPGVLRAVQGSPSKFFLIGDEKTSRGPVISLKSSAWTGSSLFFPRAEDDLGAGAGDGHVALLAPSLPAPPGRAGDGRCRSVWFESLDSGAPLSRQPGLCLDDPLRHLLYWHFCCLPPPVSEAEVNLCFEVDSSTPGAPLLYL